MSTLGPRNTFTHRTSQYCQVIDSPLSCAHRWKMRNTKRKQSNGATVHTQTRGVRWWSEGRFIDFFLLLLSSLLLFGRKEQKTATANDSILFHSFVFVFVKECHIFLRFGLCVLFFDEETKYKRLNAWATADGCAHVSEYFFHGFRSLFRLNRIRIWHSTLALNPLLISAHSRRIHFFYFCFLVAHSLVALLCSFRRIGRNRALSSHQHYLPHCHLTRSSHLICALYSFNRCVHRLLVTCTLYIYLHLLISIFPRPFLLCA